MGDYYYYDDDDYPAHGPDSYYTHDDGSDYENSDFHLHSGHSTINDTGGSISNDSSEGYIFVDDDYYPSGAGEDDHIHYVEPAVLIVICLVGLVGNGLVIFVILRQVTMRKVTYLYLTNLAVVNVFYLLTSVPISAVSYAITNWPFGSPACKMNGYLTSVCLSVNVLTLMATGLDRYLAVLHPVTSRTWRTERKAVAIIIFIWLLSFLLMIPRIYIFDTVDFFDFESYILCSRYTAFQTARRVDSTILLVTMYLLPQFVLGFCHLKIGQLLWQRRRPGLESQEVSLLALRERRRIAKIVFAITLAFGIGWLPMHVFNMYEDFSENGGSLLFSNRRVMLILGFSFGANAINPILYCLLSKHFRKHFKRALICWNSRHVGQHISPMVEFQPQNEDLVMIDMENGHGNKSNSPNADDLNEGADQGESVNAGELIFLDEQTQDSSISNSYVRKPKQNTSAYFKVLPSYQDSSHESDVYDQPSTSGKAKPPQKKTLIVSTSNKPSHPLPRVV